MEERERRSMEAVVRGVAAAGKALRLYPPTSPIPREAVGAAAASLASVFETAPTLSLAVARDGFTLGDEPLGATAPGVLDLAEELRRHGVAELTFAPGCDAQDLLAFLEVMLSDPEDVRSRGGVSTALASAGVQCVRVADVALTTVEDALPEMLGEDVDAFLRDLAADPDKLSVWLSVASKSDPAALADSLDELAGAAGGDGREGLLASLAAAFAQQDADGKDAVLGLALQDGPTRELAGAMFALLETADIASSLVEGLYGRNMLSLSDALKRLPLGERSGGVTLDAEKLLAGSGRSERELLFLEHMLQVRSRPEPEAPLVDREAGYRDIAAAADLSAGALEQARADAERSAEESASNGVETLLVLLDQQSDFDLYCRDLDTLAGMAARLLDRGDLAPAARILSELTMRESRASQPWPELTERIRAAKAAATPPAALGGLLRTVSETPGQLDTARAILRSAGDGADAALVRQALRLEEDGLAVAERMLGRRLVDRLAGVARDTQWHEVAAVTARLAPESDPRAQEAVRALVERPDERARREAAHGLGSVGGDAAIGHLGRLLRDPSPEVQIAAARALARCGGSKAAATLGARLGELDLDGKDFAVGREAIGALARMDDPGAEDALTKLASRKALIKRGHFAEVQELARQALATRAKGGPR